jgi:hypothetical protein
LKGDLSFADEEGVPRGHPQALTLVLLGYFLGWCMGIPKLELFFILQLISSFSNPYTWKLPSYKTKHNSISNISASIKYNQPSICFRFQPKTTTYKVYTTVATSTRVPWSKRTQNKAIKWQKQILAEICQNWSADKGRIFEGFSVAQIKKCSTKKSLGITWDICTRNRSSKR